MSQILRVSRTILFLLGVILVGNVSAEENPEDVRASLTDVEGVSVHATEEEPRVLHIVPWQAPSIPSREREEVSLSTAGEVLEPIDVDTFRVHRHFRQTLDVLNVDRSGP